eukprot:TRINITY_DN7374_c0_g1_i5.p5 TRINITY_DN7374_c0_g1~~TRINITY_DN7374_c0_g1_i5.p5  ORF type:complete len:101 (+),score=14.24 TRINITY_DN7374_c0_g1_i5:194-496(+)
MSNGGVSQKVEAGNSTEGEQVINLKVKAQNGTEVMFKVKQNTLLKKVFTAYCQRTGVDPGMITFLFDGERLRDIDTPLAKEMEDGDTIDVLLHQVGGSQG